MLSGQRGFNHDPSCEPLTAILKEDPPPLAEAALERIVRRCLEKPPEQRFPSASDLGLAISNQSEALSGLSGVDLQVRPRPAMARRWPIVAALGAGLACFAAGTWWQAPRTPSPPSWTAVQL